MIFLIVSIYVLGATLVGMFLKLNWELAFCTWWNMDEIDPLEEFGVMAIIVWPLFIIFVILALITKVPYDILYNKIKTWQENNKNT